MADRKKTYFIDDSTWWYSNGGYDMGKIADTLVNLGRTNVIRRQKYGWPNMPEVICFEMKLSELEYTQREFTKAFNDKSGFSFSIRVKDWKNNNSK